MRIYPVQLMADDVMMPLLNAALSSPLWSAHLSNGSAAPDKFNVQVLKYRAGRRLCLRVESLSRIHAGRRKSFIVKIWYNRRGARIFDQLNALNAELDRRRRSKLKIPRPLFYDKKAHTLAYREIAGEPITRRLRRGNFKEIVTKVAATLADLHQLTPPDSLKPRTPADEVKCIEEHIKAGGDDSEIWNAISIISNTLRKTAKKLPRRRMLIHRDLYDQQILQIAGGGLAMIDLDDAAVGDPVLDIGNFFAHLHLMKHWQRRPEKLERLKQKFLNEWRRAMERDILIKSRHVAWYESVALARLACLQIKNNKPALARLLADKAAVLTNAKVTKQ